MVHGVPDAQRYLRVYMPSREDRARWEKTAQKKGYKTMTKFVYDHVELALRNEGAITGQVLRTLQNHIRELQTEVDELKRRERMREAYVERLEEDLQNYRRQAMAPFLRPSARAYDTKLIDILRKLKEVRNDELLSRLGIKPGDTEAIRGVREQLLALTRWKLVEAIPDGWRLVE